MSGFVMFPRWLRKRRPSANACLAYLTLASFGTMNTDQGVYEECRPAVPTLAAEADLSESTMRRALKELEDLGAISGRRQWHADGSPAPTIYRCAFDAPLNQVTPPVDQGPPVVEDPGVTGGTRGGVTGGTRVVSPVTGNQEPSTKNPLTNKGSSTPRGTRVPSDFQVTDDMRRWAVALAAELLGRAPDEEKLSGWLDRWTAEFVDYWSARSRDALKVDWVATWRNRMRTKIEHFAEKATTPPGTAVAVRSNGQLRESTGDRRLREAQAALAELKGEL